MLVLGLRLGSGLELGLGLGLESGDNKCSVWGQDKTRQDKDKGHVTRQRKDMN